jgi:PAS domain S-box-containing protein
MSLHAAAAGIWSWDIGSGAIYWSAENYHLYDVDAQGGPPRYEDWEFRLHPDDRVSANQAVQDAIEGKHPEFRTEFRIVTRQGELRWLQGIGRVERNAVGEAVRMGGVNLDITARKLAEEALLQSEARFRGIFEHATTGIAMADLDGRILRANPSFCALLGYSDEELRGREIRSLVHPDDREANNATSTRLMSGDAASFEIENRYTHRNGNPIWVREFGFSLPDAQGRPEQLVALVTDMTGHRKREEHIKLLMGEVNHRAKNMLGVVDAIARLTSASSPKDFAKRFSERIHALSAGMDLLVGEDWKGVPLDALISRQLSHLQDALGAHQNRRAILAHLRRGGPDPGAWRCTNSRPTRPSMAPCPITMAGSKSPGVWRRPIRGST